MRSLFSSRQNFHKDNNILINEGSLKKLTTEIADIGISFLFDRPLSEFGIKDVKNDFNTGTIADVELRVHFGYIPELSVEKKIFDSNSTWALYSHGGKYVLQDDPLEPGLFINRIVVLEPDLSSGDVYIKDPPSSFFPDPLGYPLNQILMITLLSSFRKGVLFHASGVIDDNGDGHLFSGKSTHGKSTIAKLWFESGATILNDDRIIVREKDGQFWMYGTPWHGDFREVSPKGMPIRKIFFLKHGKENSTVPKKGAEAVSMLLTRAFPPLWDEKGMDYTLNLLDRMVSKLPCYELNFLPDERIIDFVKTL